MDFQTWLSTLPRPAFRDPADIAAWQEGMQQIYQGLTTPDSSGRLPFGTNIAGISDPGQSSTFNAGDQSFARVGSLDPRLGTQYSPEYGYYAPADQAANLRVDVAHQQSAENAKSNAGFENLVYGIVGGGALAGAASVAGLGAGAAGGAGAEAGGSVYGDIYNQFNAGSGGYGGLGEGFETIGADDFTGAIPDADYGMEFGGGTTTPGPLAGATDGIDVLRRLDELGGGQGATAGAKALGFNSVGDAVGSVNPAWVGTIPLGTMVGGGKTATDYISDLFTPTSLLTAGANIGAGLIGANAAGEAAKIQADSATQSNALLKSIYDQNRADLEPWRTTGVNALNRLGKLTAPGSQMSELELDPGYQFRLGQGTQALERSASARGNLFSGATGKALTRYGQDFASNEYGNSVNRLMAQAGLGQTATNTGVNAAQNFGTQAANNLTGAGNARASGYVGGANAIGGGITNALNQYLQSEFMNKLLTRGG